MLGSLLGNDDQKLADGDNYFVRINILATWPICPQSTAVLV